MGVEVTAIYIIPGVSTRPEWISQLIGMTFSISTPISQAKMSQVGKFLSCLRLIVNKVTLMSPAWLKTECMDDKPIVKPHTRAHREHHGTMHVIELADPLLSLLQIYIRQGRSMGRKLTPI